MHVFLGPLHLTLRYEREIEKGEKEIQQQQQKIPKAF